MCQHWKEEEIILTISSLLLPRHGMDSIKFVVQLLSRPSATIIILLEVVISLLFFHSFSVLLTAMKVERKMIHLLNLGASVCSIKIHTKIDCDHLRQIILMNILHTNSQQSRNERNTTEYHRTMTKLVFASNGKILPSSYFIDLSFSPWFDQCFPLFVTCRTNFRRLS